MGQTLKSLTHFNGKKDGKFVLVEFVSKGAYKLADLEKYT